MLAMKFDDTSFNIIQHGTKMNVPVMIFELCHK